MTTGKTLKIKNKHRSKGQAATEYVMLMAVLVSIILVVGVAFTNKMRGLLNGKVAQSLKGQFFNPRGMHRFPMSIPK